MEDFNNYAKRSKSTNGKSAGDFNNVKSGGGLFETVKRLSKQFDGKSQDDLLHAIYSEAERGKRAGSLTNAEIDGFVSLLSPALDAKKRTYLIKIAEELKKI